MIERLIRLALEQRLMVLLAVAGLIVSGVVSFRHLPIDAFPDVTPVQVQVITRAPALAPAEIERLVTFPLEIELTNLPRKTELRSVSRFGLSVITVVFEDRTDVYFARQLVLERILQARSRLPHNAEPVLGPVSTGLSEVFMYLVEGPQSLMELRTLQDWVIRPMLRAVPGLADVDTLGGRAKQYEVLVDPTRLTSLGLTLRQVHAAVAGNNQNAGGSYIEQGGDKLVVYGVGLVRSAADLEQIVVTAHKGTPIYVRDVAQVRQGTAVRLGGVTRDGKGEVLEGIAVMLRGGNSREIVSGVKDKIKLINQVLPAGVTIMPFYDRIELVTRALDTVERALFEGAAVVLLVLYLFLRNLRGALVVALTLPLATLATFVIMQQLGLSANLMSLGGLAISLGMIVDAAIVQVENVERHLGEQPTGRCLCVADRLPVVLRAVLEVRRPSLFGELIIALTFVPLLTLQGIEGKMFIPMAVTVVIALLSSLMLSMTVVPVLAAVLMKPRVTTPEGGHLLDRGRRLYRQMLEAAIRRTGMVLLAAATVLVGGAAVIPFIGREFVPVMDEGSIVVNLMRLPSISLTESLKISGDVERLLLEIPDVRSVVSRTGANELGTDPMGMELSDMYLLLKAEAEWQAQSKAQIEEEVRRRLAQVPGIAFGLSQPIAMRVDELVSGVRSQVAVKLFGDELETLRVKADEIARVLRQVRGMTDLRVEQVSGLYYLKLDIDRAKIARHGINVAEITEVIEAIGGGIAAGEVFEGQWRFPIVVRFPEDRRADVATIAALWVTAPDGSRIPLRDLADIHLVEGPAQISREHASRRIVIEANVVGRDLVGAVEEARTNVERTGPLPPGYYLTWGGQFENQQRAMARLSMVVPLVIGLIFLLLFVTFGNVRQATLILLAIPFAMVGGLLALSAGGLYLSVPASVGFIALFGVAVLNGVVKIAYINQLRSQGMPLDEAVMSGMVLRLRPVLMTAIVAMMALLPLLLATGPGSEIQRPLAIVVICGLFSSTALTLVVLPVLYRWMEHRIEQRRAEEATEFTPAPEGPVV